MDIYYWVIQQEKIGEERRVLSEHICTLIEQLEEVHIGEQEAMLEVRIIANQIRDFRIVSNQMLDM